MITGLVAGMPLEQLWSPSAAIPYLVFTYFQFLIRAKFSPEYGKKKPHLKIHPSEKPLDPSLEMVDFEVFLTFDKKSDRLVSV